MIVPQPSYAREHKFCQNRIANAANRRCHLHQNNENIHQKLVLQDRCAKIHCVQVQCSLRL